MIEYMQGLFGRITRDRSGYLALHELRLEAVRRPELRATVTRTISENLERDIGFPLDSGLPDALIADLVTRAVATPDA